MPKIVRCFDKVNRQKKMHWQVVDSARTYTNCEIYLKSNEWNCWIAEVQWATKPSAWCYLITLLNMARLETIAYVVALLIDSCAPIIIMRKGACKNTSVTLCKTSCCVFHLQLEYSSVELPSVPLVAHLIYIC